MRFIILLSILLLFAACKPAELPEEKFVNPLNEDSVVAVVDGEEILAGPVEEILQSRLEEYKKQTGKIIPFGEESKARRMLIEQLINETVLGKAVENSGIDISDAAVEAKIAELTEKLDGEKGLQKFLEQSNYTLDAFKKDIKTDMIAQKLMAADMGETIITDADTEKFYNENPAEFVSPEAVDVSHILLRVSPEALPEEKEKIKKQILKIKKEIYDGLSFEDAAKKYSECPSASNNGYIGPVPKNQEGISEPFSDAAFAANVSNVTDVVESEFGYHLILVNDKIAEHKSSFEEVKDSILDYLEKSDTIKKAEEWTQKLRAKAKVEYK